MLTPLVVLTTAILQAPAPATVAKTLTPQQAATLASLPAINFGCVEQDLWFLCVKRSQYPGQCGDMPSCG